MVFLLKSPYSVRLPAFVFLGFFKEKARAPRKLFQFFSHFLSTTRDSTTSHRKTGDLKETPGTRKQCRIVACLSTKIRAKRTALLFSSTADSSTMPFGWMNTSRESGRNIGGRVDARALCEQVAHFRDEASRRKKGPWTLLKSQALPPTAG